MINDVQKIFSIRDDADFEQGAIEIFRHQAIHCAVYQEFLNALAIQPETVKHTSEIPFLPISFFKTHRVISTLQPAQIEFSSSATTGSVQSIHAVANISIYEQSFLEAFHRFYGAPENYCFLALLPAYQERTGSSLIYMVDKLISLSTHPESGYFLYDHDRLHATLQSLKAMGKKTILIGVTYALLDFIADFSPEFPDLIVMETGGMKGRRREIIREELHEILCKGFGVEKIHSEYGMTELLSQAYSLGDGQFRCPPWMQVRMRDINDPFSPVPHGRTGGMNIIDLANVNSCSFIATQDMGRITANGNFEVLGRFDNADIRGCNLLVQ